MVNWDSSGSSPSSRAAGFRSVSSTISERWRDLRRMVETRPRASDSTREGSSGAIALTTKGSSSLREAPDTWARTPRS
ncbi:Uncharacterised protein [Mycobacteroides abscessus subsp. abscessus]|nr:Uncharacterised protein [Mycobacteroides abscessus subsp. abscessus]